MLLRADESGQHLHLRAAIIRQWPKADDEPVAILDGAEPADLLLPPGRYQVRVYATPGPFGFDVSLGPGRQTVRAQIVSAPGGHTVLLESWLGHGERAALVQRRIIGFGWGPRPSPTCSEPPPPPEPAAVFRETLRRARAALVPSP